MRGGVFVGAGGTERAVAEGKGFAEGTGGGEAEAVFAG